jgi:hypothetical protein
MIGRLRAAIPPLGQALLGAVLWAAIMAVSAGAGLWLRAWETPGRIAEVATLFACGAALAFPLGLYAARLVGLGRNREVRFAAAFLALAAATMGVTGLAFALLYRSYYAEWHAEAFSMTWGFQFFFTTAAAMAQFAVLGVRLYFPVGFLALLAASTWFALRTR